jgi:hypothetical protein
VAELIGSQFKVVGNPRAKSSCGCGTSFDVGFPKIWLHIFTFLTMSFAIDHRISGELKTATTVGMNVL